MPKSFKFFMVVKKTDGSLESGIICGTSEADALDKFCESRGVTAKEWRSICLSDGLIQASAW